MKKINLTILFLAGYLSASAQDFSVSLSIADSINTNQFRYHPEGSVILESGMELFVELYDPSQSNLVFSGSYSVDNPTITSIPEFSYDIYDKHYSMELGNYPSDKNVLKMWIVKYGETINQILYQE